VFLNKLDLFKATCSIIYTFHLCFRLSLFWYKLKDAPDDDDLERAKQTFWVVDMGAAWLVVAPQLVLHGYIGATGVHLGNIRDSLA